MEIVEAKIFVGGISKETSEDVLRAHFSKYGTVLNSLVARDRVSKNPRGFGFVWFSDSSFADKARHDSHVILGRTVEVKKAIPRNDYHQYQQQWQLSDQQKNSRLSNSSNGIDYFRTKKIFVGGLSSTLTEEQFKNYFEKFGKTVDVVVMQDTVTNRPRGFGFITFHSEESVDKAMEKIFHELNGKNVEVKRAVPKDEINGITNNITKGGVRGSFTKGSEPGNYLSYGFGYEIPSLYPVYVYNGSCFGGYSYGTSIDGTYPVVEYSRSCFGPTPVVFRSPWNGATMFPSTYNNTFLYPTNINGGVNMMGHPNGSGKLNEISRGNVQQSSEDTRPLVERMKKLGVDSSGLKGSDGVASS
ncbi:RNA-binding protein 1-like [Mercurialis annua]|uniref:RNA-binding protein 1-like n=1 Tax=Mercurialis annua TaxID=3986 RepID=UPI00215FC6AF|nr:RNA-binding protein 1-like [Mercurialis annua]